MDRRRRVYFLFIRFFGILVPGRLREEWRLEWVAELKYREGRVEAWKDNSQHPDLMRRSLGAFWDALWLQRKRLEDDLVRDIAFALRLLRKSPSYAAIAALTLALGIGANTAIFSIVDAVLLNPLPYPEAERLMTLWERNPQKGLSQEMVNTMDLADWSKQQTSFEPLANWTGPTPFNLVGSDQSEKVRVSFASSELLPTLGVTPLAGRNFNSGEDIREGNRAALIGYEFWQNRLGGDPAALGKVLTFDKFGRREYTIVGILPPAFAFPSKTEVWLPSGWNGLPRDRRNGPWLSVIGRLKPNVSPEKARAEMNLIQHGIAAANANTVIGTEVVLIPLLDQVIGARLRPALLSLSAIVLCVLLIACANVANLALARAGARQKEIAIRLALGATRLRLARQLVTESLVLGLAGGVLGLALALLTIRLVVAFNQGSVPRLEEVSLNCTVLLFTLGISLLTGLLAGLAPAWQFSRPNLDKALKDGDRGGSACLQRSRLRSLLVVTQIALALVLLVGAGLMTRSFVRLMRTDRGFETQRLLAVDLDFSVAGFTTWVRPEATRPQVTLREIMNRVSALPGVRAVGAIGTLPRGSGDSRGFTLAIENRVPDSESAKPRATLHAITPDYFRALGVPLVKGRVFTEQDTLEGNAVAIINESMARRYFPNEEPVGKRLALYGRNPGELANNPLSDSPWIEIVGVVKDVRRVSLEAAVVPDVFRPYWQWPMQTPYMLVNAQTESAGLAEAIRREIRSVDPKVPRPAVQWMSQVISEVIAQPRFYTILSALFGGLALALAAIGIYGVIAYTVSQRKREIGIRMALGAAPRQIVQLVLRQGLTLALIGLGLGLVLSFIVTRLISSLLFGVSVTDPTTFAGGLLLLLTTALIACYLPARRALAIDPIVALREE